jgi:hypothetical protein
VFWGEWEAPSYVIKRWEEKDSLPRFLHRPVWEHPTTEGTRQNTDPWVFGDSFRFSNCKQLTPKRNRSSLQYLAPGSIILFGSATGDEFVLDTLFVVRDCFRFSPGDPPESDEVFRVCTVESLLTSGTANDPLTLYRGATYESPIDGMYSFVPCHRANAECVRFPRPTISPGLYVNPKSKQSPRLVAVHSPADVKELWRNVRKQVLEAGCLLAIWFVTPQLDDEQQTETDGQKTTSR